jgi:hypothetical protein
MKYTKHEERHIAFYKWYTSFNKQTEYGIENACFGISRSMKLDEILPIFLENYVYDSIDSLINSNLRKGVSSISEKRVSKYNLNYLRTKGREDMGYENIWGSLIKGTNISSEFICYDVYLDTPIGIGLSYDGFLNSIVSFIPESDDTLMIKQIQGVTSSLYNNETNETRKKSARGLIILDWEKIMVDVVTNFAKETGFSKVGIQSSINNYWVKAHRLPLSSAIKRYDETAIKLGFSFENSNFYKEL